MADVDIGRQRSARVVSAFWPIGKLSEYARRQTNISTAYQSLTTWDFIFDGDSIPNSTVSDTNGASYCRQLAALYTSGFGPTDVVDRVVAGENFTNLTSNNGPTPDRRTDTLAAIAASAAAGRTPIYFLQCGNGLIEQVASTLYSSHKTWTADLRAATPTVVIVWADILHRYNSELAPGFEDGVEINLFNDYLNLDPTEYDVRIPMREKFYGTVAAAQNVLWFSDGIHPMQAVYEPGAVDIQDALEPRLSNEWSTWTSAPVLTGTAAVGNTLTCSTGAVTIAGTRAFEWWRSTATHPVKISGANASTYQLVSADSGKSVKCNVSNTIGEAVSWKPSAYTAIS